MFITTYTSFQLLHGINPSRKAGPLGKKQHRNKLKIRILSETTSLNLIHHASVILIVGLRK